MGMPVHRTRIAPFVVAVGLVVSACQSDGADALAEDPRAGYGNMGLIPPAAEGERLLGPETFPCRPATDDQSYVRYGVGPMRRGGLERQPLERDHIVIEGTGANFHGTGRVVGQAIEMEMDENYFAPTILKGPPGATVTIDLRNEGGRPHNFSVPSQNIDVDCGVRAEGRVDVVFPRSGELVFTCRYGATSGMVGALAVDG